MAQCYFMSDNNIGPGHAHPASQPYVDCGNNNTGTTQFCCWFGDVCLEEGICYFSHPASEDSPVTGYYIGGCTDPAFTGSCSEHCGDDFTQDIYYNATTNLWNCCYGDGSLDCAIPSTETFEGPSLSQLEALLSASATSSTSSSTSSTTSSSSSSSSSTVFTTTTNIATNVSPTSQSTSTLCPSNETCSSDQSLSGGIKAAIGVPIAICFILLTGLIFIVYRSRRKKQLFESPAIPVKESPRVNIEPFLAELGGARQQELDSTSRVELSAYNKQGV